MTGRVAGTLQYLWCAALLIGWAAFWAPEIAWVVTGEAIYRRTRAPGHDEAGR